MNSQLIPYEKYRDSSIEWLGEIPSHWEVLPTKRLFRLITDPASPNNNMELLSVYTDIGVKPRKELEERGNKASTTDYYWVVKKGNIIVNKLLAWMGAIGVSEYDGVTSPAYDVLKKIKRLNPYFYHFLFRNSFTHQELKKYSKGIMDVRLRLYFSEFGRIMLPLPPFKTQNRIAKYLNRKTKQADNFIEKQTRFIELLKEQKKAIINKAVTKGLNSDVPMKDSGIEWLGEIPAHWEVRKLKFIASANPSNIDKKSKKNELQVFLCNYVDVYKNDFIMNKIHFMKATAPKEQVKKFLLQKGDVILTKDSETPDDIGVPALVIESSENLQFESVVCGYHLTHIKPKSILGSYLFWQFQCKFQQSYFEISANGVTRYGLGVNKINSALMLLPKESEQHQIVSHIQTKTTKINQAIEKAEKEIILVKEYLQSLIYHVVIGKLEIKKE